MEKQIAPPIAANEPSVSNIEASLDFSSSIAILAHGFCITNIPKKDTKMASQSIKFKCSFIIKYVIIAVNTGLVQNNIVAFDRSVYYSAR